MSDGRPPSTRRRPGLPFAVARYRTFHRAHFSISVCRRFPVGTAITDRPPGPCGCPGCRPVLAMDRVPGHDGAAGW